MPRRTGQEAERAATKAVEARWRYLLRHPAFQADFRTVQTAYRNLVALLEDANGDTPFSRENFHRALTKLSSDLDPVRGVQEFRAYVGEVVPASVSEAFADKFYFDGFVPILLSCCDMWEFSPQVLISPDTPKAFWKSPLAVATSMPRGVLRTLSPTTRVASLTVGVAACG